MSDQVLEAAPYWAVYLCVAIVAAASLVAGRAIGARRRALIHPGADASVGVIVAAALALTAFLLTMTFDMAASRYEDRRQTVVAEANAIGATYQRADLLPEPARSEIRDGLRRYVRVRLLATDPAASADDIAAAVASSEAIQRKMWESAASVARRQPTITSGLFILALGDVMDRNAERISAGLMGSVPISIWLGVALVTSIGLFTTGYQAGLAARRRTAVTMGLILAFTTVLTMIADLDNPRRGFIRISQAPMVALLNGMGAQ